MDIELHSGRWVVRVAVEGEVRKRDHGLAYPYAASTASASTHRN